MEQKKPLSLVIAVFAFSSTANIYASVNALIASISASYPNVPMSTIMLISTLPSAVAMIGSLIIGAIVGKKISYKASGAATSALSLVFGLFPVFFQSIVVILVSRAVVGFAAGMFGMRNAYIIQTFTGNQREKLLGFDVTASNAASIVVNLLVGVLGEISWQKAFWVYLIFIIPLFTSLFLLKEPEKVQAEETAAIKKHRIIITRPVWIFFVFVWFSTMTLYPILTGMSTVLEARGLGGPAQAATCLSLYTVGGVIAGIVFGPIAKKIGARWMLLYACILVLIGQAGCNVSNNVLLMMIFTALAGWGFSSILPAIMTRIPGVADPDNIPLSTTIVWAGVQGAAFTSSYWINLCAKISPIGAYPVEKSWWVCAIFYVLLSAICVFWNPDKKTA